MGFRAVDHSVNIIGIRKNDVNYAMCCAWAMMVDYDKLMCLLGSQSDTGNNICKGDIIGFTSLNKNQIDVAYKLGDNHSSEVNKLDGVKSCSVNLLANLMDVEFDESKCSINIIEKAVSNAGYKAYIKGQNKNTEEKALSESPLFIKRLAETTPAPAEAAKNTKNAAEAAIPPNKRQGFTK